jgi:hypothetical protein
MYGVPGLGAWWHAVGPPLERRVRLRATPDNLLSRSRHRQALLAKGFVAFALSFGFATLHRTLVLKLPTGLKSYAHKA